MARICEICEKRYLKANLVPRGVGRRVTRRTITTQKPNLRSKKFVLDGQSIKVKICASCLKRLKFDEKKAKEAVVAK